MMYGGMKSGLYNSSYFLLISLLKGSAGGEGLPVTVGPFQYFSRLQGEVIRQVRC
jgi:hypothetical protein